MHQHPSGDGSVSSTSKAKGFGSRSTELALDEVWRRAADTPIPAAPPASSRSLLEVLVDSQRERESKNERQLFFAKHVAKILVANTGATDDVIQAALDADPYLQSIAPGITVANLEKMSRVSRVDGDQVPSMLLKPEDQVATILSAIDSAEKHGARRDPMSADDRRGMASRLLFEHVLRRAAPTWTNEQIVEHYTTIADAAKDRMPVDSIGVEQVTDWIATTNEGRSYQQDRLRFREALLTGLRDDNTSLSDAIDAVVPKHGFGAHADDVLLHDDVARFVLQDRDLAALFTTRFERAPTAERQSWYPALTDRVRNVFGDRVGRFSVGEIGARMRRDDPVFTETTIRELAAECSELLGGTPDPADSRNFLTAVNLANTMHRMWPGATYADLVDYLEGLGPLSPLPADFDPADIDILTAYDFVPRWPNGVKPAPFDEQMQALERSLFGELRLSLRRLPQARVQTVRDVVASELADAGTLREAGADQIRQAFRDTASERLLDIAKESSRSWSRHDGVEALLRLGPDRLRRGMVLLDGHARTAAENWSRVLDLVADGRGDELVIDQSWAAWMTPAERNRILDVIEGMHGAERDVLQSVELHALKANQLKTAIANYQKVPVAMPITQGVVEAARSECDTGKRKLPFENTRVVMIQHELGQAYPQVEAYRQLGMDPTKCIFIGKPYHPNPEVESTLLKVSGVDGRFLTQGDLTGMKRATEKAVDDAFKNREPGENILIVCDGPHARKYAEEKYLSKDPGLAKYVRFTEQTAIGHRGDELASETKRVVSYARHKQKIIEAPYIARAGIRAIQNVLNEARETLENKTVFVKGIGGPIGRATADALLAIGVNVVGQDIEVDDDLRAWADERGIRLADELHGPFMVIGCAGATTIDGEQIDGDTQRGDGGPCYYVSMSSELVEVDMSHVEDRATTDDGTIRRVLFAMVNDQPTYAYVLDDGSIRTVMAGGLPVNFQDVNSLAPETIDATMAMSVAAAVEVMEGDELGFFGLSRFSDVIDAGYRRYLESHEREA